jgi:hypothetical protein
MIEAQVREWCEQFLLEVVLAARNSHWNPEQLDALLSPSSFAAALLPRQLLHSTVQKRLGQKLGAPRRERTRPSSGATVAARDRARSRGHDHTGENDREREEHTR